MSKLALEEIINGVKNIKILILNNLHLNLKIFLILLKDVVNKILNCKIYINLMKIK
jgi:hypothetical protein